MRILVAGNRSGCYNQHLHFDFFEQELQRLGHTVHRWRGGAPGVSPFSPTVAAFQPDVVISHKPRSQSASWLDLPSRIKRVAVMVDYHYESEADQYLQSCDLVCFRHSDHLRVAVEDHGLSVPRSIWLPFSVDGRRVPPPRQKNYNRIFFAGNRRANVYPARARVLRECRGYFSDPNRVLSYKDYLNGANKCGFGLACKSKYNIDPAKLVEYASVGCIPLCDGSPGQEQLLPGLTETYALPADVERILSSKRRTEWQEQSRACRQYVQRHHTHQVRAQQFMEEVCSLF